MESISVITYRGFSTVNGETTLAQDMADIKNGKYARLIIKIASLVIQGKTEEANNVKKQLPFRTLTANYRERRLAYGIIRYNPVITLDLDELEEDRLEAIRSLINNDPGSPHHRSRKRSEKTAGKKTCRHRGVSPHRSFSPARSRALGETAILQSGDRRKTQHEIQKGKP